ncbi:MAG: TSUP family transporter [Polyangiaceae bacterium]|nr:TSUP family transporter [Polyangiaceae bacterium]
MVVSLPELALLVAAALGAGIVDAIAGGGGLVTLPVLLGVGLPPHLALGTNKGQSVWGAAAALLTFARARKLDGRRARVTFPCGLVGSLAGAALVLLVAPTVLRPVVLALLVAVAVLLALPRPASRADAPAVAPRRAAVLAALIAFCIGAYDGFFGPGTGTFLIVAFNLVLHLPFTSASADAKVVNFASNLAAVGIFAWRGVVLWELALPMAAAQFCGGVVGARLAVRGGDRVVRAVVLVVVIALVARLGYDLATG